MLDSTIVNKAKFYFLDENELILEYLMSDEIWKFKRLQEEVKNIDNNSILKMQTRERSLFKNCKDSRTMKEKQKNLWK